MRQRACTSCRKWYYRVNKMDLWTGRNPGHRVGWYKQEVRLCVECCTKQMASRVITVAHVRVVEGPKQGRKAS